MMRALWLSTLMLACGTPGPDAEAPAPPEPVEAARPEAPPPSPAEVAPPPPEAPNEAVPPPTPEAPAEGMDGAPCMSGSDCTSGVCEGTGCGPDQPGTCQPKDRICTQDYVAWCGCDGKTFHGSGGCPGQRVLKRGACD